MTEKEAYIYEWAAEVAKEREELGGFSVCPYASGSKTKIIESSIDDIVPESGYDVIVFIVDDFWNLDQIKKWVEFYNDKFPYYSFFEDCASQPTFINGVQTNNKKFNLILCQSKKKLNSIRKKLAETEYYNYWSEEYLKEILGEDYELVKNIDISG
jgi:hypothetical protein